RALEELAARKKAPALEISLILERGRQTHLTNADLQRVWTLASGRRDSDLAWRVASVLEARQSLVPQVRHAWQISGERRSQYPFLPPSPKAVERCLTGFKRAEARLAHAIFVVGKELPELLAILDKGAHAGRMPVPKPDSIEARIDQVLSGLSWLGPA